MTLGTPRIESPSTVSFVPDIPESGRLASINPGFEGFLGTCACDGGASAAVAAGSAAGSGGFVVAVAVAVAAGSTGSCCATNPNEALGESDPTDGG